MAYSSAEKEFYQRHYAGGLGTAERAAVSETEARHFVPGKRYHLIMSELDPQRPYGTAVEIGCSDGDCAVFIASRFKFKEVIGVDIAFPDDMQQETAGVKFMQANSNEKLPLADGSVEVYVAMMVIEHLFDPFHAFLDIKRVLTPGGMAFVNLPLVTSIKNRLRLLSGRVPVTSVPFDRWFDDKEWDGNHLHYFSLDSIHRLAALSGLEVTRVACVGTNHKLKNLAPSFLANELSFVLKHRR
jgi:SAM-dependent methyltransferase